MTCVAARLAAVRPSALMAAGTAAKALWATGVVVPDPGPGEPDFPAPTPVAETARKAALSGGTLAAPAAGTLALRKAVAERLRRGNGLDHGPDDIVVASGARQIVFHALMAMLNAGDEAILPALRFVISPEMVKPSGGVPVTPVCGAATGFRLAPAVLDAAITPRTEWLVPNMPGNPSGAAHPAADRAARGDVPAKHPQVQLLCDEIHEHMQPDGRGFGGSGKACPEVRDRTLIVKGVAMADAMSGWRVGHAAGPAALLTALETVQCPSVTPVAAPMQAAALAGPQDGIATFGEAFERRPDLVVAGAGATSGLTPSPSDGVFCAGVGGTGLCGGAHRRLRCSPTIPRRSPACRMRGMSEPTPARPAACRPSSASRPPHRTPARPRRWLASDAPWLPSLPPGPHDDQAPL